MVIRRRMRSILFPLCLYCVSGAAGGYFVWHAVNGARGLKTQDEYQLKINRLRKELDGLKADRELLEHKISLMRGAVIDRDLLDEEARNVLGRDDKNDLIILLPKTAQ